MKRPDKMTDKEKEILKGMLHIITEDQKTGTSITLSSHSVEYDVFLKGYVNATRRDKYTLDVQFTQKGIDYITELKAMNIQKKELDGFYWYWQDDMTKKMKNFDPINTEFIMNTHNKKDYSLIEHIKEFKEKGATRYGFAYVLGTINIVDSIIDGEVIFNQKEIDTYVKSSTSRQKSIAKKVIGFTWKLDKVEWNRDTGKIYSIEYYCQELNAGINICGDEMYSHKASIKHALEHNKQEVLEHLRKSTPPEMMILFTEAILGGMTGVRDIINDTPSQEARELDKMKTKGE